VIDSPALIVRADNVSVTPGDGAQLVCVIQSSSDFSVTWRRPNKNNNVSAQSSRFTVHDNTAVIRSLHVT